VLNVARDPGAGRGSRALTREESRERRQIDGCEPAGGKHPDNPRAPLAAFCRVPDVKDLLTRHFAVEPACNIGTVMATHAVVVRSREAGFAR
jgi:hypothetical protein